MIFISLACLLFVDSNEKNQTDKWNSIEVKIRKFIYDSDESCIVTFSRHINGFPRRELRIPKSLKGWFDKFPVKTLELLLKITEGAESDTAHRAFCYAIALELDPVGPIAHLAHSDLNYEAVVDKKNGATHRMINCETIRNLIKERNRRSKAKK